MKEGRRARLPSFMWSEFVVTLRSPAILQSVNHDGQDEDDADGNGLEIRLDADQVHPVRQNGDEESAEHCPEDATLAASYRVENRTGAEMPFLWAMHGLLAPRPGDRIALPGRRELAATYVTRDGGRLDLPMLPWPDGTPALGFRLDEVQPEAARFAGKFYGEGGIRRAALGRDGEWLVIAWQAPIEALGVWLNYGGWPEPPRGHHLALEPTTAAADHLGQALAAGRAARIAPGGTATWTITLTLARTPS